MTKSALITGVTGQDGAYLARFLLANGYDVYGTFRRSSSPNFWRLQHLGILDRIKLIPVELIDSGSIIDALKIAKPSEFYHLAAQSFVGISFEQPVGTGTITGLAVTRVLEAIRHFDPEIRFYQASSSELYGQNHTESQNEMSATYPVSPYAAGKLYGQWITKIYREAYDIFACCGILFNHESPIRGLEFVTRKISNAVAKISLGISDRLELGNIDSVRDWGYAPEYVEAMWAMLQQDKPDDFVIATNESHSVREFAQHAFELVGLDWKQYVVTSDDLLRPIEVPYLRGDYTKAKSTFGWEPKIHFRSLVKLMVKEDVDRWTRWKNGEHFPWDAANYHSEAIILSGKPGTRRNVS